MKLWWMLAALAFYANTNPASAQIKADELHGAHL